MAIISDCPWQFLFPDLNQPSAPHTPPQSSSPSPSPSPSTPSSSIHKTFAQALKKSCDIPLSQLPRPCMKGDALSIKISEEEYHAGVADCKNILHGRLTLSKGDSPIKIDDLRSNLSKIWKLGGSWTLVSLGKGFYEFNFESSEDLRNLRSIGSWNLHPGVLRVFAWTPDFHPTNIKQTNFQCWVRFHGVPREYWRPKILFEIGGAIGVPIALDETTRKRSFGHFARILIDIDLSGSLQDKLLVEREGYAFFVDVEYEKLPPLCSYCQTIGHSLDSCRHSKHKYVVNDEAPPKGIRKPNMQYVPRKDAKASDLVQENNKVPELLNNKGKGILVDVTPPAKQSFLPGETSKQLSPIKKDDFPIVEDDLRVDNIVHKYLPDNVNYVVEIIPNQE